MAHFRSECVHGTLVAQCRCISKDKEVRVVECPMHCPKKYPRPAPDATQVPEKPEGVSQ